MIEFRDNTGKPHHPQYEIIEWEQGRSWCVTVAVFEYNEREPCWYLKTIGDRIVDLNPVEFMTVVKEGFKFLESKERCLTCGRKYDDDL